MSNAKQPASTQHEPRVPGGKSDEPEKREDHPKVDHPNKPFRTPGKNKTHPAPEVGTDGDAAKRRAPPRRE